MNGKNIGLIVSLINTIIIFLISRTNDYIALNKSWLFILMLVIVMTSLGTYIGNLLDNKKPQNNMIKDDVFLGDDVKKPKFKGKFTK